MMVSYDTGKREILPLERIETKLEVETYLHRLQYSLEHNNVVFVMSFHYAERPFMREMFPYGEENNLC